MKLGAHGLVVVAALAALEAAAQAPVPVAERITTQYGRTTRVSLFSNHVVVVTINSENDRFLHRAKLEFDEYMVYLQVLQRFAGEIGRQPVSSDVESRDSVTTLILHVGPDAPKIFTYSPMASLDLSLGKIAILMDDIETRALAAPSGEYELRHWQPELGDCVALRQGGRACVTEIGEDDTIVLTEPDSGMTYTVAKDNRAEVILEVLGRSP
jgi:hypothetical protein